MEMKKQYSKYFQPRHLMLYKVELLVFSDAECIFQTSQKFRLFLLLFQRNSWWKNINWIKMTKKSLLEQTFFNNWLFSSWKFKWMPFLWSFNLNKCMKLKTKWNNEAPQHKVNDRFSKKSVIFSSKRLFLC